MDRNCMFHLEVYDVLRRTLAAGAPRGFGFLDIACGDAAASAQALRGTGMGNYVGIDISRPALDLAAAELAILECPVTLIEADFVGAVADWRGPVDVVWIGQSLHHLRASAKRDFMRDVRQILSPEGVLLIWEPTTLPGEPGTGWLARFETSRPERWTMLTDDEWSQMYAHCCDADHQETADRWLAIGREAGFAEASEIYVAPNRLARVYAYRD